MKRPRTTLVALLAAAAVGGCCGLLPLYWLHHQRMQDDPALVYRYYERELHGYAQRLEAGEVYSDPNRGYAIPPFLIDHGARYVVREGGCFVVVFGFLPPAAVPELWYSPQGFDPLPPGLEEVKRKSGYFRWESLSPHWGACHWDQ
jgi:hypothetical protein